ncbi:MAG TPA: GH1 family beta-glucosidase [Polyangiaceae bacterium]|nr:GH1 family beta-glucosidase [Polyangiaceae bacterium]
MDELSRRDFGPHFRFGVATSSYQIEGAVAEDGRKPSIWDDFTHRAGTIRDGSNGDVACDHYHRLEADLDLLAWFGVDAYRFSVAWPRVVPDGRGRVNEKGLDFYERLVDGLLARGIAPCVTLYHWDLPSALAGGWLARDTVHAFVEYAEAVAARLGDRVALWHTHNEPWCQAFLGYQDGTFAPGHQRLGDALTCAHHLLLSHGLATAALRARVKAPLGIALNFMPAHPASDAADDHAAARRVDGNFNRWFLEPLLGRGYPADMLAHYGAAMPNVAAADLAAVATPIDVLGVNYYERIVIGHDPAGGYLRTKRVRETGLPRTADREIYAPGLREILVRLQREYGVGRLVVTENGAAFPDTLEPDGSVHDAGRVDFLRRHLAELAAARREGVPVEGYFAWSLMDNFEWSEGYTMRYGLCHVDFATQERRPKDSAKFFRELCRRG